MEQMAELAKASADPEIPLRQREPVVRSVKEIVARVAQAYGQEVSEVERRSQRPSEARRLGGAELRVLGQRFGLGYTAVSRRVDVET